MRRRPGTYVVENHAEGIAHDAMDGVEYIFLLIGSEVGTKSCGLTLYTCRMLQPEPTDDPGLTSWWQYVISLAAYERRLSARPLPTSCWQTSSLASLGVGTLLASTDSVWDLLVGRKELVPKRHHDPQ